MSAQDTPVPADLQGTVATFPAAVNPQPADLLSGMQIKGPNKSYETVGFTISQVQGVAANFASPPPVGSNTPNTGAFTSLSATSLTATSLTATSVTATDVTAANLPINVKSYNATGNGTTNDTAAFTAALAAASASSSRTVTVPPGLYLIDPITLPTGVALVGEIPGPMDPQPGFLTNAIGATLLINSHATSFITLNESSCLKDVVIYDPGQVSPTASAPNVFPAQVLMASTSRVRGVTLCNAYIGIKVTTGRSWVEDCYIGAYKIAVDVDTAQDVTFFNNVWCGVFYDTCLGIFPWQNLDNWAVGAGQGIGFRFGRADAVSMVNCGTYIKWCGIYIMDGSPAGGSYGWATNIDIDSCVYGVVAVSCNAVGWRFTNATFLPISPTIAASATPIYLEVGGSFPPVVSWIGGSNGLTTWWTLPNPVVNAGNLTVKGVSNVLDGGAPSSGTYVTPTGTAYSVSAVDGTIIVTPTGAFTLTLGNAVQGRILWVLNQAAFAIASASANVVPLAGGAAGTSLLSGTAGKYAMLQGNGTNWQIVMAN